MRLKKRGVSRTALPAVGDGRGLLYEDRVSADLLVEVDDVLDDQADPFMCAVWRMT